MDKRPKSSTSSITIKELKSRYKLLLAQQKTIKSSDMIIDIPISTGSPLIDSFFLEKIQGTNSMASYEHLMRSFQLLTKMTSKEEKILLDCLDGCLNDHLILLAAKLFDEGEDKLFQIVLKSLPMSWQLLFPAIFIKPSLVFFDGWKKEIDFRLYKKFNFSKLRKLYAAILERTSDSMIVKYRERIHTITSLLGYKFETAREKAIENWCYEDGRNCVALPLLSTYVAARDALQSGGEAALAKELEKNTDKKLPLTLLMGLLSSKKLVLYNQLNPNRILQNYAVESATPIECVLKLNEWSNWLNSTHYDILKQKISKASINLDIPFSKITQAYLMTPVHVRKALTDTIFIPLLKKFGDGVSKLIPNNFVFYQPANLINIDNFVLYNVFQSASSGKMVLTAEKEDYEYRFTIEELKDVLNMELYETQNFLLKKFGRIATTTYHEYDAARIVSGLKKLDQGHLLLINTPFYKSLEIADQMRKWSKVINLSSYYGAPSEISIKYNYDTLFYLKTKRSSHRVATLNQDQAVYKSITYMEKLSWFEKAAIEVDFDG